MNLPNQVNILLFSFVNRKRNLSGCSRSKKPGVYWFTLLKKATRSFVYNSHWNKKWISSSTKLQYGHSLFSTGVIGFVHLSLSISKVCELDLSLVIAFLNFFFVTYDRYFSVPKLSLSNLYVLNLGFSNKSLFQEFWRSYNKSVLFCI